MQVYEIDTRQSALSFSARAMFGSALVRGSFAITGGRVERADDGGIAVEAVVDAGSVDTGLARRDAHIVSADYLEAARHPEMRFSGSAPAGATVLRGDLTVAGRTRPVELALAGLSADAAGATADVTTEIDRYAFGVTHGKGMTGRRISVTIHAVAVAG